MTGHSVLRVLGLYVFLFGGITVAQVTTGTISGTVKDSTGAVLPGTNVTLLNEENGISRTVMSGAEGRYSSLSLSVGNYQVTGTLAGFQTVVRRGIVLTVGREVVVDLTLPVGSVVQAVEVIGNAPLVESTTASLGSLVDDREIRALPLNGRSFDQMALFQPGVILTDPGPMAGTSLARGSGKRFSVGGQRPGTNSFLLDGTNINDQGNGTPGGAAGTNLGVDTIREFQIFTNSFKAEYGHSSGSVVTAITRSGTNSLHGTAFEYIRNSALDARNFFDLGSSPPSFKRNQFGGVLGGPIKKDKTFFFGGYEGLREGLGTTLIAIVPTLQARQGILPTAVGSSSTITVPVNSASVPFLDLYPLPNGRDFEDGTGEFLSSPTIATNEDNFMVRVDHQLNENTGIFGRYTFDDDSVIAPQQIPSQLGVTLSRRQYTTLQVNSILGPTALNNFRFAFNRTNSTSTDDRIPDPGPQLAFIPGQPFGSVRVGGLNAIGANAMSFLGSSNGKGASFWVFNTFEWGDDFSYVSGKHSLKAGVDIKRIRDNTSSPATLRGQYTFSTFNDFLAGKPSFFQASSPLGIPPYFGFRQSLYAVYGQDDYTVKPGLTLNLGLRWEAPTNPIDVNGKMAILPSPAATDTVFSDRFFSIGKKNFEPRVGLAWQLNASGKTVLRAGGGIYHNQILPWAYSTLVANPPFFGVLSAQNPPFPGASQLFSGLSPGSSTGLVALQLVDPVLKTPVSYQYNLSIQQELSRNTVVEVAYAGNHSSQLPTSRAADTPIPTILPDGQKFFPAGAPLRNPAWASIQLSSTDGNSDYNSVTVKLQRESSSGFRGQIFYTFSKVIDEMSTLGGNDSARAPNGLLDPEDRGRDGGLAEFDSRHVAALNFSYSLPFFQVGSKALGALVSGWTVDGIGTFRTGLPLTARLSRSVSRDGADRLADRPDLKPGASQNPNHGTSAGCPGFPAGTKLGGADNFYDPCSFSLPQAGTYGNLGRNTIIGPGSANIDLALGKSFKLHENANVTLKVETFNILNRTNLGLPRNVPLANSGEASPSAGRVSNTTTSSRQMQFGLRINF